MKKTLAVLLMVCFMSTFIVPIPKVFADTGTSLQQVVSFPESTSQSQTQTINIPDLQSITSVTTNNGTVAYTVNGTNVTLNVSNGNQSNGTNSITANSSQTNTTGIFDNTMSYNNNGYTGTLSKDGNSSQNGTTTDTVTGNASQTNTSNSFPATMSYSDNGYTGTISKSGDSTQSGTTTDTITGSSSQTNTTNSFPATMSYSNNGYTGTLSQSGNSYPNGTTTDTVIGNASQSNTTNSFPSTYSYSYNGYTGTIPQSGSSIPSTTTDTVTGNASQSNTTNSFPSTYSYSYNGYTGTIPQSGSSIPSTTTDTVTGNASQSNTTNSFPSTYSYSYNGYTGSIPKSGGSTQTGTTTDTITGSASQSSATNSFPVTVSYSNNGYTGTLSQSGASYVISGSYTPADSTTGNHTSSSTVNSFPAYYSYSYNGYTGSIPKSGNSYKSGTTWYQAYSGTVTKPASDSRVWQQSYSGSVSKQIPVYTQSYSGPVSKQVTVYTQNYSGAVSKQITVYTQNYSGAVSKQVPVYTQNYSGAVSKQVPVYTQNYSGPISKQVPVYIQNYSGTAYQIVYAYTVTINYNTTGGTTSDPTDPNDPPIVVATEKPDYYCIDNTGLNDLGINDLGVQDVYVSDVGNSEDTSASVTAIVHYTNENYGHLFSYSSGGWTDPNVCVEIPIDTSTAAAATTTSSASNMQTDNAAIVMPVKGETASESVGKTDSAITTASAVTTDSAITTKSDVTTDSAITTKSDVTTNPAIMTNSDITTDSGITTNSAIQTPNTKVDGNNALPQSNGVEATTGQGFEVDGAAGKINVLPETKLQNGSVLAGGALLTTKIVKINIKSYIDAIKNKLAKKVGIVSTTLNNSNAGLLALGVLHGIDDNVSMGFFSWLCHHNRPTDNYYYMRAKTFTDSVFTALFVRAAVSSASAAIQSLQGAGAMGAMAVATSETGVGAAAFGTAALKELSQTVVLGGVAFVASLMSGHSESVLIKDVNKLKDIASSAASKADTAFASMDDTEAINQGITDVSSSEAASEGRRTWRQSEEAAAFNFPSEDGFGYNKSYKIVDGQYKEVPYGTEGSIRPDYYKPGLSVDVKNYKITTSTGRTNLANNIANQCAKRSGILPAGTKQMVMIDIKGQAVTDDIINSLVDLINSKTTVSVIIKFMK